MKLLHVLEESPDEVIANAIQDVIEDAEKLWEPLTYEGEYPTTGFGISTLRPYHVGDPNASNYNWWDIAVASANTWQDWLNTTIDEKLYVIVCGLFNTSAAPGITEVAFKANGQDLPVQNIEPMYTFEKDAGKAWFSSPFVVKPEGNLTSRIYGKTAQTENLGLLGFAIAKRALLITES